MNLEVIENKIFYYKNIIKNPNDFINKIEELDDHANDYSYISKWKPWTASTDNDIFYGYKKEGHIHEKKYINKNNEECLKILLLIKNVSDNCITDYVKKTKLEDVFLPNYFSIRKYNSGADMGPHADSDDPTADNHPYISGVMYLNDEYNGGELDFINQKISIKPEAGSMIIFPSYRPYIHHPKPPENGIKYMSPFFWFKK